MSTPIVKGPLGHDVRFNENAYPFWRDHFAPAERQQMVREDLRAGESVAALLFAIVAVGVALGLTGVLCSL